MCGEIATRDKCSEITIDGKVWRYSLSRANVATQETVIVDFGGPGVPTLISGYLTKFISDYPEALAKYNVLAVEEPWALHKPATECRSAASAFYVAARTLGPEAQSPADRFAKACEIGASPTPKWGFGAASYRALVDAIHDREDLQYVGFVGQSFGSVRLSYLTSAKGAHSLKWAALSHPFPVGASADDLVTARAAATESLFSSLVRKKGALSHPREHSRNLPITEFDRLSAMAGLGYVDSHDQERAARDIASRTRPATVAQFSDEMWQRYGSDEIAPVYLAQMDEVCSALKASDLSPAANLRGILSMWLMPCAAKAGSYAEPMRLGDTKTCVVTAVGDPVTPYDLVRKTLGRSGVHMRWVKDEHSSHSSTRKLDECLSWATAPS
jgi:hypothetical protein